MARRMTPTVVSTTAPAGATALSSGKRQPGERFMKKLKKLEQRYKTPQQLDPKTKDTLEKELEKNRKQMAERWAQLDAKTAKRQKKAEQEKKKRSERRRKTSKKRKRETVSKPPKPGDNYHWVAGYNVKGHWRKTRTSKRRRVAE